MCISCRKIVGILCQLGVVAYGKHTLPYDAGISLFPALQPIRTRIFTGGYIGEFTERVQ